MVKSHNPNKGFLNPPYDVSSDVQLEFIENTLECLTKGGRCIAICQMSTTIKQDNKTIEIRRRLLEHHTLEAVFSMPDQLFYPKGVVTSILVFTAHIPHPVNKEVFFGYFKDDGHILKKYKGRLDDGSWSNKKEYMLNKSGNSINEWKEIQQNRLIGVEVRSDMFTHACSNMMMRGDGKSNIYKGDCFDDGII